MRILFCQFTIREQEVEEAALHLFVGEAKSVESVDRVVSFDGEVSALVKSGYVKKFRLWKKLLKILTKVLSMEETFVIFVKSFFYGQNTNHSTQYIYGPDTAIYR